MKKYFVIFGAVAVAGVAAYLWHRYQQKKLEQQLLSEAQQTYTMFVNANPFLL